MRQAGFALCAVAAVCSGALPPRVDDVFRAFEHSSKAPGAVVAVVRDGEPVYSKSFGLADIERGLPNNPTTIFRLGSITKTFTAVAALQLSERGKLRLDDPLSKYVSGFPEGILIRHLLTHTAGVIDFVPLEEARKLGIEFAPGSRINYSNNGYQLLGRVIEKVTGASWEEYLRAHVFLPLAMKNTGYDKARELPGRAVGFLFNPAGGYKPVAAEDARGAWAAGGLYSTVEDLIRFEKGLVAGKLLKPRTLEMACTPGVLADGRTTAYGMGWMISKHRGLLEVGHGGDITGFNSAFTRYPEHHLTVIVLSNTGMRPTGPVPVAMDLSHNIAEAFLGDHMGKEETPVTVRVEAALLDKYAGRYKLEGPEVVVKNMGGPYITIARSGDMLIAEAGGQKVPLEARSKTLFQSPGSPVSLTFVPGAIIVNLMGLREFRASRVD